MDGFVLNDDLSRITNAKNDLKNSGVFIEDPAELNLQELRESVGLLVRGHRVGLIIVDRLDLMGATWKSGENRQREIAEISSGIKKLAVEFNVPFLVLVEQGPGLDSRTGACDHALCDQDLSAPIARFADVVYFLHPEDGYPNPCEEADPESLLEDVRKLQKRTSVTVLIAKNRNGLVGNTTLSFMEKIGRFVSGQTGDQTQIPNS